MFIQFSDDGQPTLADGDNFRELAVKVDATATADQRRQALSDLGTVIDESHVKVDSERLVQLAGEHGNSPDWRAAFDQMLDYARGHGWVDDAGLVQIHVETA